MLHSIKCKHLIAVTVTYFVIIFTGAFVVNKNSSTVDDSALLLDGYDQDVEESLSFLDGFVDGDVPKSPWMDIDDHKEKKIVKRSISNPTVPQYMLDIYERLLDKRLHIKFDTARSFHSSSVSDSLKVSSSLSSITKRAEYTFHHLFFNVSHFPQSESALFAQLRIQLMNLENIKLLDSEKLEIYSLLEDPPGLLTSRFFNPSKESLFTVNITNVFQKALQLEAKQLHMVMTVPKELTDSFLLEDGTSDGPQLLVLSKTVETNVENKTLARMRRSLEEKNSQLALFQESEIKTKPLSNLSLILSSIDLKSNQRETGSSNSLENYLIDRYKNLSLYSQEDTSGAGVGAGGSEDEDEEMEEQSNYIVEELGRIRKGKMKKKKNPCRRKPMHVNFAAINYDQWIIAPPSYEAFECTGKCSFPMSAHLAPTKHAIIQTLIHSLEPKQVSRACCVPIKLTPISILYVDDDGTVTYRYDYEDMVVSECGCR